MSSKPHTLPPPSEKYAAIFFSFIRKMPSKADVQQPLGMSFGFPSGSEKWIERFSPLPRNAKESIRQ